ncbi:unnamed protein product [Arabidopsis thaliana]|nr:unnamed protein product [Arabidopsis thaliana]
MQHMVFSLTEAGARLFVTRFFRQFISIGCVTILEGDTIFIFGENESTCPLKSILKIHSPQFYWKVMTLADLGLADAYINGDFSFVDKDSGLLNLIMILIANRDLNSRKSNLAKKRGWWTPVFLTASLASATYYLKHSNEFFGLFMDDTMMYSSAVFKVTIKNFQNEKNTSFNRKGEDKEEPYEVLEIGCGWGTLAIEVVKRTGCKYTGFTLSIEQLKYVEEKVKEAGLQERITFKLCDYRQLCDTQKYDRIISCEMIEHVGHKFMETFFSHCEAALAEDGIFVLQFTAIPEELYDESRLTSGFITEYIFPGGCLPSLARVTSAMASSSRLCIENVENIGIHYYPTLRYWRKNLLERQKQIIDLGFDEKFLRTWEYYFDYCAAGFKTLTLRNYQIVFSRPGNVAAFGNDDPFHSSALTQEMGLILQTGNVSSNVVFSVCFPLSFIICKRLPRHLKQFCFHDYAFCSNNLSLSRPYI